MADIVTSTLQIGSNNLILRDADAQAKVAVNTQDISSLKEDYTTILDSAYVTDTASGAIASFPDGADGIPVKSLSVDIEPVQSGSGDPSPTNIRPISGHTSATVTVSPTTDAQDGTSYTIDLGGTRYGGTLNVTTGVLTVDRAMVTLNGTETWNTNTAAAGLYYTSITGIPTNIDTGVISNAFTLTTASGVNMTDGQMKKVLGSLYVNFKYSLATTLDAWKTWLGANNVQLVYPLATPFTVQLSANEISTVLGQNNVWNDCGNTEVEYRADTKLYIQKVINS